MARKHANRKGKVISAAFETLEARQLQTATNAGLYYAPLPTLWATAPTAVLPHAYADLNDDGYVDMVRSTGSGPNATAVLLGEGAGQFDRAVYYPGGHMCQDIEIADVNNDGHLDVLSANANDKSITVLRGLGDGTFTLANTVTFGDITPTDTSVVDFTHDGKLDLVICGYSHSFPLEGVIGTMEGNGDGTFGALKTYIPSVQTMDTAPFGVGSADFNGDGWADFITTHRATQPGYQVYLNNHNRTFAQQTISMMALVSLHLAARRCYSNSNVSSSAV